MATLLKLCGVPLLLIGILVTLADVGRFLQGAAGVLGPAQAAEGWKMVAAGVALLGIAEIIEAQQRNSAPKGPTEP